MSKGLGKGATRYFYAEGENLQLVDNLDRGEISKIVNNALKEYAGLSDSLERVKKNLDLLYQEQNVITSKIKYLEKRKKELEAEEEKKKAAEEVARKRAEKQAIKDQEETRDWAFKTNKKALLESFETGNYDIDSLVEEYLRAKDAGQTPQGFKAYFSQLGLRPKEKRREVVTQ